MADKKKAKTEEKAKGLVGWEGGKQSKKKVYVVGKYKGRSLNLSEKELGAKGVAASKARKVDISQTRYDAGTKKVYGPAGKPLTGRVDLGGGNIAVYRNGVRVTAKKTGPSGPKKPPQDLSGPRSSAAAERAKKRDAARRVAAERVSARKRATAELSNRMTADQVKKMGGIPGYGQGVTGQRRQRIKNANAGQQSAAAARVKKRFEELTRYKKG